MTTIFHRVFAVRSRDGNPPLHSRVSDTPPLQKTAPVNGYHSAILCGEIKNATRLHFKFDHRSFIVKHEHNQSICTKRLLLQITWLPPRGRAQQLDFLADVGMEGRWDPRVYRPSLVLLQCLLLELYLKFNRKIKCMSGVNT